MARSTRDATTTRQVGGGGKQQGRGRTGRGLFCKRYEGTKEERERKISGPRVETFNTVARRRATAIGYHFLYDPWIRVYTYTYKKVYFFVRYLLRVVPKHKCIYGHMYTHRKFHTKLTNVSLSLFPFSLSISLQTSHSQFAALRNAIFIVPDHKNIKKITVRPVKCNREKIKNWPDLGIINDSSVSIKKKIDALHSTEGYSSFAEKNRIFLFSNRSEKRLSDLKQQNEKIER